MSVSSLKRLSAAVLLMLAASHSSRPRAKCKAISNQRCAICTTSPAQEIMIGRTWLGVGGRKAATVEGVSLLQALISGHLEPRRRDEFLRCRAEGSGTTMRYITDEKERGDVIANGLTEVISTSGLPGENPRRPTPARESSAAGDYEKCRHRKRCAFRGCRPSSTAGQDHRKCLPRPTGALSAHLPIAAAFSPI